MPDEPASSGSAQAAEEARHAAAAAAPSPRGTAAGTEGPAGQALVFTGRCPSCTHDTMFSVPYARPDVSAQTVRRGLATSFTMYCECGYPHPGHPDGDNSCGAYWPYEAEL